MRLIDKQKDKQRERERERETDRKEETWLVDWFNVMAGCFY